MERARRARSAWGRGAEAAEAARDDRADAPTRRPRSADGRTRHHRSEGPHADRPRGDAEQDPTPAHNFDEVNLGFTERLAVLEAERCLQCKRPRASRVVRSGSTSHGSSNSCASATCPRRERAPRRQRPALRHRPGLPAGAPVRRPVPAREEGHAGGDRPPRALRRRLGAGASRGTDPSAAAASGERWRSSAPGRPA